MTSLWLFHPPGIISVSLMVPSIGQKNIGRCWPPSDNSIHQESFLSHPWRVQQGQGHIGWCWLPSDISVPRELPLAFAWALLISPSSRQLFSLLPSFITGSGAGDSFLPFHWSLDKILDTALSCFVQQAGCLLLSSLHHWSICIMSKWFPTISVGTHCLVILKTKITCVKSLQPY